MKARRAPHISSNALSKNAIRNHLASAVAITGDTRRIIARGLRSGFRHRLKADDSFVTDIDLAVEKGDIEGALQGYRAAEKLLPNKVEVQYWSAVSLVNAGRLPEALPLFKAVFAREPAWAELTSRLPKIDLRKVDEAVLMKILSVGSK